MECLFIPFLIAFNLKFACAQKVPTFVANDISKVLLAKTSGTTVLEGCNTWKNPFGDSYPEKIQPMEQTAFIWTCESDSKKNVLLVPYDPSKFVIGKLTDYTGDVQVLLWMLVCHNGYYMRIVAKLWIDEKELNNASMVANLDRISKYNFVPGVREPWFKFNLSKIYKLPPGEHTLHFDLEVITTTTKGLVGDIINLIKTVHNYKKPVLTVEKTKLDPGETTVCVASAYPEVEWFEWECDSGNWNAKGNSIAMRDPGSHTCRCSAFNTIEGKKFTETWSGTLEIRDKVEPSSGPTDDDSGIETSNGIRLHVQKIIVMLQVWSLLALLLPD